MTSTPQITITFVAGSTHDLQVETWVNGQRLKTPLQEGMEILQIRHLLQDLQAKATEAAREKARADKAKDDRRRAKIRDYINEYHPRQLALVIGKPIPGQTQPRQTQPSSAPNSALSEANLLIAFATKNGIF
jgi:hypothetical protein